VTLGRHGNDARNGAVESSMTPKFDNPLDQQFAGEAAASLGRAGRQLRKALDALKKHDADIAAGKRRSGAPSRADLIAAAGEAFWGYVVQRELLGLVDPEYIAREYHVPPEVLQAMGPRPIKRAT
jgi:hypothetical protein